MISTSQNPLGSSGWVSPEYSASRAAFLRLHQFLFRLPGLPYICSKSIQFPLRRLVLHFLPVVLLFLIPLGAVRAQSPEAPGAPLRLDQSGSPADSSRPPEDGWSTPYPQISFTRGQQEGEQHPDTSISFLHRKTFLEPAYRNLGNHGSATRSLIYQMDDQAGPRLGYTLFDPYAYTLDSLPYYQTNRPYSLFRYQLGSKQEQTAEIFHTQNIDPGWNVAVGYRKITSPGFFQIQRTNHDQLYFSSGYKSRNQRYSVKTGGVYNLFQQDENGGILSDSFLHLPDYGERKSIPVAFQQDDFGSLGANRRSPVSNRYRQLAWAWDHVYQFGPTDSLFNADSTQVDIRFQPRFGFGHRLEIQAEKLSFKDLRPDSLRYAPVFAHGFQPKGADSLWREQRATRVDNQFFLQGYMGKNGQRIRLRGGIGLRLDQMSTEYGRRHTEPLAYSTYVSGDLRREAQQGQQWIYGARAQFYLSGPALGNTRLSLEGGRHLDRWGTLRLGLNQLVAMAPYRAREVHFSYFHLSSSLRSEKTTQVYGHLDLHRWKAVLFFRYHLFVDYLYLNAQGRFQQADPFSLIQAGLSKNFQWRSLHWRNEWVYQPQAREAPLNLPPLWGRHQLSLERSLFRSPLQAAIGLEFRYHSAFTPPGYLPLYLQYYAREGDPRSSFGEISAFFNFRVKRFRAYVMADQIQRLLGQINTPYAPGYPGTDLMIRFGFLWELIN